MIDTIAIAATEETEAKDSTLEIETDQQSKTMIETSAITATEETEAKDLTLGTETDEHLKPTMEPLTLTPTKEVKAKTIALEKETDQQSSTIIETIVTEEKEARDSPLERETNQQLKPTIEHLTLTPTKDAKARTIALDPKIIKALHPKARIIRAHDLPTHPPSRHLLIHTRSPMPSPLHNYPEHWLGIYASYHLKLHPSPLILKTEYASARAIHYTLPHASFIAKHLACGTLSQDPSTHFLLSYYHDLDFDLQKLNLTRFIATLASLHLRSGSQSALFGFNIPTHAGALPLLTKTWEGYFTATLHHLLGIEAEVQGPHDSEMQGLVTTFFRHIIPRLLRPLETAPNAIRPMLLHGNISADTVATSRRTGAPMVSGACAFYGHNEFDLCAFVGGGEGVGGGLGEAVGGEALRLYRRFVRVSEPREDFGERMRLYGLVGLVRGSCGGGEEGRGRLVERMRGVVGRFWGDGRGDGRWGDGLSGG